MMTFFSKLSGIAKGVSDKTGELLEINKYNQKIGLEKARLYEARNRLGNLYWEKFSQGEQLEPNALAICTEISAITENVNSLTAELEAYKVSIAAGQQAPCTYICPLCKKPADSSLNFCPHCGVRLEKKPSARTCPSCGRENAPDANFCQGCAAKLAE